VATKRRKTARKQGQAGAKGVRRRAAGGGGLRQLPPDLDDLASGRRDVLRPRRKPTGRLGDSRVAGLIPGVANHEARRVYDARVESLRAAAEAGSAREAELARGLYEARRLGLWRARQLTGFDAFAVDVVGVEVERARALVQTLVEGGGLDDERLPDTAVALWLRGEAALLDRCPEGRIEAHVQDGELELRIVLPLEPAGKAGDALGAIGRKAVGLTRLLDDERDRRERERRERDTDPER
jgi:hypothetical protein